MPDKEPYLVNIAIKRDREKIPYAKPQPLAMRPDLLNPLALDLDAEPELGLPQAGGVDAKPLLLNVSQGFYANLLRMRRSGVSSRHCHTVRSMRSLCSEAGTIWKMTGKRSKAARPSNRPEKRTRLMFRNMWTK